MVSLSHNELIFLHNLPCRLMCQVCLFAQSYILKYNSHPDSKYPQINIDQTLIALDRYIHYGDVLMGAIASQITSLTIVYSTVYSDADQRKHQSSASLAFVWGIHWDRWIPRTKGQLRGKCFHLMTSSWINVDLRVFPIWAVALTVMMLKKSSSLNVSSIFLTVAFAISILWPVILPLESRRITIFLGEVAAWIYLKSWGNTSI